MFWNVSRLFYLSSARKTKGDVRGVGFRSHGHQSDVQSSMVTYRINFSLMMKTTIK